jgi:general secretion pathway protein K
MFDIFKNDKGIALVFVLWVLIFLTIITGSFCFSARKNSDFSFYEGLHTKAYYIAEAGIYKTIAGMIDEIKTHSSGKYRINIQIPPEKFSDGEFKVFISNYAGKVNLNKADANLLRLILGNFELSEENKNIIIDSILDWRDKDHLHRLNGAEQDYYQSLPKPYDCRNGDFITISELLKVRGITKKIFNAGLKDIVSVKKDENLLLPLRSSIQNYLQLQNREVTKGIQTFLSLEKRRDMSRIGKLYDYSKININAASQRMLISLPGMTQSLVKEIVAYRKEKDFISLSDFEKIVGKEVFAGLKDYVSLALSRYYTITSVAGVNNFDVVQQIKMDIWLDNTNFDGYKVLQRY